MKKNQLLLVFSFFFFFSKAQIDSNATSKLHIGIIPYQFLSRSSGLYVRYDFENTSLEFRPTYTYATNILTSTLIPFNYDNFYFQGINNSLILYVPFLSNEGLYNSKIGFIFSYKYWWYDKKSVVNQAVDLFGGTGPFYTEIKSTYMSGFGGGIEFTHDFDTYNLDISFFTNISLTVFKANTHVYSLDKTYRSSSINNTTYPCQETNHVTHFNITAGFKFGYKNK